MGLHDVIDSLKTITLDPAYRRCVEWLGTVWGHAVAPSTPVQDFRLHVRAWQHHFAAIFGLEALSRVRGFSPPEMALPNHPDVSYEFVRTLKECGYRWVLVQEHSVEQRRRLRYPPPSHPSPAGCKELPWRDAAHHGHHQDPGQRHQAYRADAAVLRGAGACRGWTSLGNPFRRW